MTARTTTAGNAKRIFPTVQEIIEDAIRKITRENVKITGSGRTDAGVHAIGQVANFSIETQMDPKTLQKALNSTLPRDISIIKTQEGPRQAFTHSSAPGARYTNTGFSTGRIPPHFRETECGTSKQKLDTKKMREAAAYLEGTHDFSVFATADITVKTTVRTVKRVHVRKTRERIILVEIEADGFLKRMVRMITGTLVETGRGKLSPEGFGQILAEGQKTKNVFTAPPSGLFLKKVIY